MEVWQDLEGHEQFIPASLLLNKGSSLVPFFSSSLNEGWGWVRHEECALSSSLMTSGCCNLVATTVLTRLLVQLAFLLGMKTLCCQTTQLGDETYSKTTNGFLVGGGAGWERGIELF